jgi:mono/diheme cytochrome c family protein
MFINIAGLLLLFVVFAFFVWLAGRAWRSKKAFVKWAGVVMSGLLALVFLVAGGVIGRGLWLIYRPMSGLVPDLTVERTPESVARGEHLAASLCSGCHSVNGDIPLSGSDHSLGDDVGLPIGTLVAPNLTPGGPLKDVSDGVIWRIFRYGVHPDGRMIFMPVSNFKNLSDEDVLSLIAYLRSQPAVQYESPRTNLNLLAAALAGSGLFNFSIEPVTTPVMAPPKGPTVEYGAYIVNYNDCHDCHGLQLDGHPTGPIPPGPDLRAAGYWTVDQFIQALRTGVKPDGTPFKSTMPWKQIGRLDDIELTAVHAYLHSLPPLTSK